MIKTQARKEFLNRIVKRTKQFIETHKHKKTLNKIITSKLYSKKNQQKIDNELNKLRYPQLARQNNMTKSDIANIKHLTHIL